MLQFFLVNDLLDHLLLDAVVDFLVLSLQLQVVGVIAYLLDQLSDDEVVYEVYVIVESEGAGRIRFQVFL